MTTADERLAQIRARLAAATPGPWVCAGFDGITAAGETIVQAFDAYQNDYPNGAANEEFIAHARADIPYLLQALADAEARAARDAAVVEAARAVAALPSDSPGYGEHERLEAAVADYDAALADPTGCRSGAGGGLMSDDERLAVERMQEAAKAVTMLVNAGAWVTLMAPDQQARWLAMYDRALATYESCLDAWTAFHRAEG